MTSRVQAQVPAVVPWVVAAATTAPLTASSFWKSNPLETLAPVLVRVWPDVLSLAVRPIWPSWRGQVPVVSVSA
jgi:hypothetical protein